MNRIATATPHLRVRSGPGTDFREVGQIPPGSPVVVEESNPAGGPWVYVLPYRGWVHSDYLAHPDVPAKPTGWRLAVSLERLRQQVNDLAPKRSKQHDGTIGDRAHAARKSDHNPLPSGIVTALDITHDPAHGCDCRAIADALAANRDQRIKYLIFQGEILSSKVQPWRWRPYTGPNAHMKHLHISVDANPDLHDDGTPWRGIR